MSRGQEAGQGPADAGSTARLRGTAGERTARAGPDRPTWPTSAEPARRRERRAIRYSAVSETQRSARATTSRSCAGSTRPEPSQSLTGSATWTSKRLAARSCRCRGPQPAHRLREEQAAIGPRQRWALDVLRDPGVAYAPGAEEAEEALSVGRSSAVRKALGAVETSVHAGDLTVDEAAAAIVAVIEQFGLQAVAEPALPQRVTVDDLGVVCWMAVLPRSD